MFAIRKKKNDGIFFFKTYSSSLFWEQGDASSIIL